MYLGYNVIIYIKKWVEEMNKIMECTYELIDELDKSDVIRDITMYKDKIMNNKELRDLIDRGNSCEDEYIIRDIKKKLYEYDDYKGYMECYNKLMYMVMDINNRFNELVSVKGCHKI